MSDTVHIANGHRRVSTNALCNTEDVPLILTYNPHKGVCSTCLVLSGDKSSEGERYENNRRAEEVATR